MSAAAAAVVVAEAPPKKGKKKMLIIIIAVAVVLLAAGGGGALWLMKKHAAEAAAAEDGEDGGEVAQAEESHDKHAVPSFLPLDPFTVNLADRNAERYAQVGITLELDDAHSADEIKGYMPAIRNNILLLLSHKSSEELMQRDGKLKLAEEIRREALRPLGFEIEEAPQAEAEDAKPHGKKKKKREPVYPIKAVQFSNFIIQ
jgi:flagellar protein FliL